MKIKKIASLTLAGALAFTAIASHTVLAAESEAKIIFTQPTDAPGLLNPGNLDETIGEDPEQIEDFEDKGTVTGETGPLTLDYVSNLDFGTHEISVSEMTYEALDRAHIQVTDRRGAQSTGWKVTVQASQFSNEGQPSLEGASITFKNGTVATNLEGVTAPTTSEFTVTTGGQAVTVTNAAKGSGVGTWLTIWDKEADAETNSNVTLTVPQNTATPGTHVSTLTWTLADAPGQ